MKYNRIEVALKMKETGIVPVFYHSDIEIAKSVLKACFDGGIRIFEFTNRGDFAHEVFSELNKYALAELPGMMLGVGSIVDAPTAAIYMQMGANFVVSPVLSEEVIKICNRRKVLVAPGCGSLTEINYAEELGVEIVKIFPATQVGGPEFIKAVKGPRPMTNIMPTGGVSPEKENIGEWIKAGAYCVGMGSKLFVKDAAGSFDLEAITETCKTSIEYVQFFR